MWQAALQAYIARRESRRQAPAPAGSSNPVVESLGDPTAALRATMPKRGSGGSTLSRLGSALSNGLPDVGYGQISVIVFVILFMLFAIVPTAGGQSRLSLIWLALTGRGSVAGSNAVDIGATVAPSIPPMAVADIGGSRPY